VPDDAAILATVRTAFAGSGRPEHFADPAHCLECADHDALLQSRDLETLGIADVGNPCWDPICFVGPAGLGYFFPALARLALADTTTGHGWYAAQLLFHLTYGGAENRHLLGFGPDQRRAVAAFLLHLLETRPQQADESLCADDLLQAIDLWSAAVVAAEPREATVRGLNSV
jgi:hypothetical protein